MSGQNITCGSDYKSVVSAEGIRRNCLIFPEKLHKIYHQGSLIFCRGKKHFIIKPHFFPGIPSGHAHHRHECGKKIC